MLVIDAAIIGKDFGVSLYDKFMAVRIDKDKCLVF